MTRVGVYPRLLVLAWLGVALVISGCGFKLRGEVDVPPELNPMYIQASGASPVAQALRDRLRGTQVRLLKQTGFDFKGNAELKKAMTIICDEMGGNWTGISSKFI